MKHKNPVEKKYQDTQSAFKFKKSIVKKIKSYLKDSQFGDTYSDVSRTIENIDKCCSRWIQEIYQNQVDYTVKSRRIAFETCKNKMCPICAKAKSNKIFAQTSLVMRYLYGQAIDENDYEVSHQGYDLHKPHGDFIPFHLTLTIKNPSYNQFPIFYDTMNEALVRLFKKNKGSKELQLRNYTLGYQASREVSQSSEAAKNNELHPHIHVLLLLSNDILNYKGDLKGLILKEWNIALKQAYLHVKNNRIKEAEELNKSVEFDYDVFPDVTQVDIREIKSEQAGKFDDNLVKAIAEVSKYPLKPESVLDMSADTIIMLMELLKNRQTITYSGIFRQARKELCLTNPLSTDKIVDRAQNTLVAVKYHVATGNGYFVQKPMRKFEILEYALQNSSEAIEYRYASKNKQELMARNSILLQDYKSYDFKNLDNLFPSLKNYSSEQEIQGHLLPKILNDVLNYVRDEEIPRVIRDRIDRKLEKQALEDKLINEKPKPEPEKEMKNYFNITLNTDKLEVLVEANNLYYQELKTIDIIDNKLDSKIKELSHALEIFMNAIISDKNYLGICHKHKFDKLININFEHDELQLFVEANNLYYEELITKLKDKNLANELKDTNDIFKTFFGMMIIEYYKLALSKWNECNSIVCRLLRPHS